MLCQGTALALPRAMGTMPGDTEGGNGQRGRACERQSLVANKTPNSVSRNHFPNLQLFLSGLWTSPLFVCVPVVLSEPQMGGPPFNMSLKRRRTFSSLSCWGTRWWSLSLLKHRHVSDVLEHRTTLARRDYFLIHLFLKEKIDYGS